MNDRVVSKVGELRRTAGLTQRDLADRLGVTESTISKWESGRNGLNWFVAVSKLCHELRCAPDDLYELKDIEESQD